MPPTTTDVLAAITRLTTTVDRFASRLTAIETRLASLETATEVIRQIQAAHSDRMSAFATQLEAHVQILNVMGRRTTDEMTPQEEMNMRAAALLLANIFHGFPTLRPDAVPPGFKRVLETAESFESYLLGEAPTPSPGPPRPALPR